MVAATYIGPISRARAAHARKQKAQYCAVGANSLKYGTLSALEQAEGQKPGKGANRMTYVYTINESSFATHDVAFEIVDQTVQLAVEIAREGREGRKIGTLFTIGDEQAVLQRSTTLILDPLLHHPDEIKYIGHPSARETIKELAQLDGAFVVSKLGIVCSACRYINASAEGLALPLGLGSRHVAAASISRQTQALAVVVSESSVVRVFNGGEIVAEILPELWLLGDTLLPRMVRDIMARTKSPA